MNKVQKWIAQAFGIKSLYQQGGSFQKVGTNLVWLQDNQESYINEGYCGNDIVYSIISIASEKARVAPWNVYKIVDESSLKLYHAEFSKKNFNIKKALDYRTKALELYTGDGKLNELLDWPNEQQTFSDLVAESMISKMSTGNRYIRAILLDGGANTGKPQELHALPSQWTQIFATNTFPARVAGYQVYINGIPLPFSKEEVMHDKMPNPVFDFYGSQLYGQSPLKAMIYNLTRSKYAKQASTSSFVNLGPDTIIYVDDTRMTGDESVEQAGAVKKKLYEEHSGVFNRKKMAVSGYKMGAIQLGLSPVDLNILNSEKWDVVMIANCFNFPHIILFQEAATHDNLKEAEKSLTSRCVLPHHTSFRNNFNRKLQTDWGYKGQNICVDFDLSVYNELNPDMVQLTGWIKQSDWLTIRMRYELQQQELPPEYANDPMVDKIFVPTNLVPLDDLNAMNMNNIMNQIDGQLNGNGQQNYNGTSAVAKN